MISGRAFPVTVSPLDTVGDLKAKINDLEDVRPESQRLFFADTLLEDSIIAMEHIRPSSSINMVVREYVQIHHCGYVSYNRKLVMEIFVVWRGS